VGLVGGFALRKARNLEQVGDPGDGSTSASITKTLKADVEASFRARARKKTETENARSGWPGAPGTGWTGESLKEAKSRRGERSQGRLNTDLAKRDEPRSQSLEVEQHASGSRATGEGAGSNGRGASPGDEPGRLWIGRNP
jgi:hypothetical protein